MEAKGSHFGRQLAAHLHARILADASSLRQILALVFSQMEQVNGSFQHVGTKLNDDSFQLAVIRRFDMCFLTRDQVW